MLLTWTISHVGRIFSCITATEILQCVINRTSLIVNKLLIKTSIGRLYFNSISENNMKITNCGIFLEDKEYQNIKLFSILTSHGKITAVCNLFSADFSIVLYFIGIVISYMMIVAEISDSNEQVI